MPRFLLVRGRQGVLVPNPHALDASPMRVAGQRPLVGAKPGPLHTLFELCDEVLIDSPDLLSAVAAGDLTLLGKCVADNHTAARAQMSPPMPAPPTTSTATKRGAPVAEG